VKKAPSNVKFLGYIKHKEMPKYLNYADVVVSPQSFEGWGRVILEAMSSGKPVIATSSSRAYAAIGFKGWPIKPGDIEGLRKAIIEASKTPKQILEEMGRANREIILRKFNWNITYKKILKIVKSYC
jgi:glycosyltransferase involved in cell wall biosynthesis